MKIELFIESYKAYNCGAACGEWASFDVDNLSMPEFRKFMRKYEKTHRQRLAKSLNDPEILEDEVEEWFLADYEVSIDGEYLDFKNLGGSGLGINPFLMIEEIIFMRDNLSIDEDKTKLFIYKELKQEGYEDAEALEALENCECMELESGSNADEELGRELIDRYYDKPTIPESLIDYIDYESYGRDYAINMSVHELSIGSKRYLYWINR